MTNHPDRAQRLYDEIQALPTESQRKMAESTLSNIRVGWYRLDDMVRDEGPFPSNLRVSVNPPDGANPKIGVEIRLLLGDVPLVRKSRLSCSQADADELARQFCVELIVALCRTSY